MTRRLSLALTAALAALAVSGLGACAEKPQTATARKADDKPWDNASAAYAAPGFKAGDAATWEQQIKARNQSQNEYNRTATR